MAKKKNKKAALFEVLSRKNENATMGVPDWAKAKPAPKQKVKKDPNLGTPQPLTEESKKLLEQQQAEAKRIAQEQQQLKASRTEPIIPTRPTGLKFPTQPPQVKPAMPAQQQQPANNITTQYSNLTEQKQQPTVPATSEPIKASETTPETKPTIKRENTPLLDSASSETEIQPPKHKPAEDKVEKLVDAAPVDTIKTPAKPQIEKIKKPTDFEKQEKSVETKKDLAPKNTEQNEVKKSAEPADNNKKSDKPEKQANSDKSKTSDKKHVEANKKDEKKRDYTPVFPKLKRPEFTQITPEPHKITDSPSKKIADKTASGTNDYFEPAEPILQVKNDKFIITMGPILTIISIGTMLVLLVSAFMVGRITASESANLGTNAVSTNSGQSDQGNTNDKLDNAGEQNTDNQPKDPMIIAKSYNDRIDGRFYLAIQKLSSVSKSDLKNAKEIAKFCNKHDLPCDIAKLGGYYFVWSRNGFASKTSPEAKEFIKKVEKVGKEYLDFANENNLDAYNFKQLSDKQGDDKSSAGNFIPWKKKKR